MNKNATRAHSSNTDPMADSSQAEVVNPYLVLGLERGASQEQIRQAYFALVQRYTPEKDPQRFKIVRAAYEQLDNPAAQAETDLFLVKAPPDWVAPRLSPIFDLEFHPQDAITALQSWESTRCEDHNDDSREVTE